MKKIHFLNTENSLIYILDTLAMFNLFFPCILLKTFMLSNIALNLRMR